ncbi:exosome complex exonuclease Rrp41 [Candidatus Micrarchaeota archaeon]|nr:exosome complex exonuclease Rrp41 [Candidatus Micrarchaeota archaeon]
MEKPKLIIDGKRIDGRSMDELRPLKIQAGVLNKADGSAYVEWGGNKVLAAVYGPRECIPRHDASPYRAIIHCRYLMAPFSTLDEHGRSGPNRRSTEVSKVIKEVFENVVMTEKFPKTAIDIFIEVLQADGGTRCAGITAAAVALADAGIPMKDLPCAVAVGKIENEIAVDFGKLEDNYGDGDMPIAIAPRNNELLLLQMDGMFTKDELRKALELAFNVFPKINALQVEALRAHYAVKKDELSRGD